MSSLRAYKQKDSMQCGIACIQMVCCYFGRKYSTEFISQYCHSTTEGVSLLSISETVKEIGIKTISGRVETNQLVRVILPCILHWNQNHFVVLYKVKKGKDILHCWPRKGTCKIQSRRIQEALGKYAIGRWGKGYRYVLRTNTCVLWKEDRWTANRWTLV